MCTAAARGSSSGRCGAPKRQSQKAARRTRLQKLLLLDVRSFCWNEMRCVPSFPWVGESVEATNYVRVGVATAGGGVERARNVVSGVWAMCSYNSPWVLMPPLLALSLTASSRVVVVFYFSLINDFRCLLQLRRGFVQSIVPVVDDVNVLSAFWLRRRRRRRRLWWNTLRVLQLPPPPRVASLAVVQLLWVCLGAETARGGGFRQGH
ncbi:unnamed protein product [Ectocarpus sp. 12 AP-2014]